MAEIIKTLKKTIDESNILIEKEIITNEEIINYKRMCLDIYFSILNENYNETINDIAKRGLKYDVTRFNNPIIQWFYNRITEARDWITFKAPYLRKKTDSDYYKTYIFWTIKRIEGIIYNFENNNLK
jgi:hypothetical protein